MNQAQQLESMAAFFNTRVSGYEAHMKESGVFEAEKRQLAEQFGVTAAPVHILDLGCGTGLEIAYVLQRVPNARFVCIDLAEKMLDQLRLTYQAVLTQIETIQASYLDYDLGRERYDYAMASATMHHWLHAQKQQVYRKIFAALKPGGCFMIDDYIVPENQEKAALERYRRLQESGGMLEGQFYHVDIPFSVSTEQRILAEAGFGEVRVVYEHYGEKHCNALLVGVKAG